VAATREHALELTLLEMKNEWKQVNFSTKLYRLILASAEITVSIPLRI
jgi:hypothetical protein